MKGIEVKVGNDATYAITNNVEADAKVYNVTKPLIKWVQLWEGGPYWADRNVGASSETDYGEYFAWGKVEPKSEDSKDNYAWGTWDAQTKYNSTDGKTTLDLEDDAAYWNWGGNCRMPTQSELQELLDNTNDRWTEIGSVNGRAFRGKANTDYTSNSIFLPFAGYRSGSPGNAYGYYYGYYWSSSLDSSSNYAWALEFGTEDARVYDFVRSRGQSIRPVRDNL